MAKLKLTKTIVNGNKQLIGFVVSGKERDLGGFSDNIVERGYPVDHLLKTKFANSQIAVVTKGGKSMIVERGNFKINSLPMVVFTNSGNPDTEYVPVDNSINLIQRFVQNNENIGFRVKFGDGSEDNLKYANVIMICKWFKPGNFSIRTSAKGNVYISGKKDGITLDELPMVTIGEEPEKTPKRMKSAAKENKVGFSGSLETGFDILDIYELIRSCNGAIIKLPSENYVAHSDGATKEAEEFTSLGIGEVASPKLNFNATKLNVNATFKKVGVVSVPLGGVPQNITTYVNRNKSIFMNGDNYIKKFGIAVPSEKEEELLKSLGKSLALEKITDTTVTAPLSQVIDAKSLVFYKVDSSKIDLISEKKRKASILSAKKIAELCKKQYELKLISKYLGPKGGVMKELKEVLNDSEVSEAKNRSLFGLFSMMNEKALQAITEAGIDVYTGAYTKVGKQMVPSKDASGEKTETIEITYILDGMDFNKITGSAIKAAALVNNTSKVPEEVINIVNTIENIGNPSDKYKKAYELYKKTEAALELINEKFWKHNASMLLTGNKSRIHSHDSKKWELNTSTRVKTAQVYNYIGGDVIGLTVKFTGVSI